MTPDIAVLVLNHNRRDLLAETLEACSRLDSDGLAVEVWVIDNGSRDGSAGMVRRRFPEVKVMELPENLGFSGGYNRAIDAVDATWIGLLNNDAPPRPQWLAAAHDAAQRTGAVCVASRMLKAGGERIDFAGASMNFYGHGFHPHRDEPAEVWGDEGPVLFACAGAMLCRRDVFRESGGFDDRYFAYFEDVDLGWRLNVLGHDVVYAPDSVVDHNRSSTSVYLPIWQRLAWQERNGLRSVIKNYDDLRLSRVLPAAMSLIALRGALDSSIDTDRYFFERSGDRQLRPPSRRGASAVSARGRRRSTHRLSLMIRELGIAHTARHVGRRLLDRSGGAGGGRDRINRIGYARIAALDDVILDTGDVARRRADVQRERRKPDSEITRLFRDTFRPSFPHPEVKRIQDMLVEALGIAELM